MHVALCVSLCLSVTKLMCAAETLHRFEPFSDEEIEFINQHAAWKAGRNFDQRQLATVRRMLGVDMEASAAMNRRVLREKTVIPRPDLPKEFDARTKWPSCTSIGEIRDQASCGSCWAFGAVEVMTDRICINGGGHVTISAQDLMTCCKKCGRGCEGGFPCMAYSYYYEEGIVTGGGYGANETCRPYSLPPCDHHTKGHYKPCGPIVPTPPCDRKCHRGYPKPYDQDKHFGQEAYDIHGVDSIAQELVDHGPVTVAFDVYADFPSYKSGVYKHVTGEKLGGHAVKIIGYGVEDGQDYWLVANSWNADWGDHGFFKIAKGTNECGIESQVIAGQPKLS